jgi:hypothetical protein
MIYLLSEIYNSKFENRNKEMMQALHNNLECEHVEKVIIFHEDDVKLPNHEKIISENITGRMTYADYFNYINTNIEDKICGIHNSDIYFEDSIKHVKVLKENEFICLSRYNQNGKIQGNPDCSQDSWFINSRKKIPTKMMLESCFNLGEMRCDNRISYTAFVNDYHVLNPSLLIKSHHLHANDEERTYELENYHDSLMSARVFPVSNMKYSINNVCSLLRMGPQGYVYGQYFKNLTRYINKENQNDLRKL